MNRCIRKRRTRRSRLWLAVFGVMSIGLVPFSMCDDDGGDFDCGDTNCDSDCDTDGDGYCDCDTDRDGDCDYDTDHDGNCDCAHHKINSDQRYEESYREMLDRVSAYDLYSYEKSEPVSSSLQRQQPCYDDQEDKLRKKRIRAFWFKRKKIPVGLSSYDLLEVSAITVQQLLKEQAFTKIKLVPVLDIGPQSHASVGKVKEVTICGQNIFIKTDMFPYDTPITIYYHDKKEVTIPYSAKALRKQNFQDVYNQLKALGFTNLHKCPKKDIVLGWFSKEGEVEEVCIAGNNRFKKNTTCKFDVEILIRYHTSIITK